METASSSPSSSSLALSQTLSSSGKTLPHRSLNLVRTYLSFSPEPSQTRSLYLTKIVLSQLSISPSHSHDISINKHMKRIKGKKEKFLQSVTTVVKGVKKLASRVSKVPLVIQKSNSARHFWCSETGLTPLMYGFETVIFF
ncbi:uncharacterized protein LOC127131571 [Lathyrus oleraceus]|uniref:uncharacterized protein LOC127131571 n=1 Tax=Pisum sativum TaxID=3888 RepID=UPI0021D081C5|nr:uncharacterized protein LOC127131571 [Pisum sativum]